VLFAVGLTAAEAVRWTPGKSSAFRSTMGPGRSWWVVHGVASGFFEGRFEPGIPRDFPIPADREEAWRTLLKKVW